MKKLIIGLVVAVLVFVLFIPIPKEQLAGTIVEYAPISKIYKVTKVEIGPIEGIQIEIFGKEVYTSSEIDLD